MKVWLGRSSGWQFLRFDEDSTWLKSLPVREDFDKGIYRHYRLFTYDDVYNIIAVSYEFAAEL